MSDREKAEYIAEAVQKWTRHNEIITAEKVLEKCASKCELDWWYFKIRSLGQ